MKSSSNKIPILIISIGVCILIALFVYYMLVLRSKPDETLATQPVITNKESTEFIDSDTMIVDGITVEKVELQYSLDDGVMTMEELSTKYLELATVLVTVEYPENLDKTDIIDVNADEIVNDSSTDTAEITDNTDDIESENAIVDENTEDTENAEATEGTVVEDTEDAEDEVVDDNVTDNNADIGGAETINDTTDGTNNTDYAPKYYKIKINFIFDNPEVHDFLSSAALAVGENILGTSKIEKTNTGSQTEFSVEGNIILEDIVLIYGSLSNGYVKETDVITLIRSN